jgi:hypothetical protein
MCEIELLLDMTHELSSIHLVIRSNMLLTLTNTNDISFLGWSRKAKPKPFFPRYI